MIGIYKITSPSGKIYIGQSIDINKRWNSYKNLHCKQQPRLYRSIIKHGVENHIFEIVEECSIEELNNRERYWQEFYKTIEENGLNCSYIKSDDKRTVLSDDARKELSERTKKYLKENGHPNLGKKRSEETKRRMSESGKGKNKGRPAWNKSKKFSEESCKRMSESRMGTRMGEDNFKSRLIINSETGIFYSCIREAAEAHNIPYYRLRSYLQGYAKNKTKLIYV